MHQPQEFESLDQGACLPIVTQRIRSSKAVQVVGHVRPDGDCIGSMLAMHQLLNFWGIKHAMAAQNRGQNGYAAMEGFDLIAEAPDPEFRPDLCVYVDCASLERGPDQYRPATSIVNIDHHGSNTLYGEINWIEPGCAATGEMIFHLLEYAHVPISHHIAEALLVAISTDTGSFRFSNAGARQHRIAAALIDAGAAADRVARMAYGHRSPQGARMVGHVLEAMQYLCEGRLAWSELRADTYARLGGELQAPENLVDEVRGIRGVEIALLFHEPVPGRLRLNLRSDSDFDVSAIAQRWGGGGHPRAAGLTLEEVDYTARRDEIIEYVRRQLDDAH